MGGCGGESLPRQELKFRPFSRGGGSPGKRNIRTNQSYGVIGRGTGDGGDEKRDLPQGAQKEGKNLRGFYAFRGHQFIWGREGSRPNRKMINYWP